MQTYGEHFRASFFTLSRLTTFLVKIFAFENFGGNDLSLRFKMSSFIKGGKRIEHHLWKNNIFAIFKMEI
jgi:hypothetical protein